MALLTFVIRARERLRRASSDAGQATAEYGLVLVVAGALALGALAWARESGFVARLFESVVQQLLNGLG